MKLKTPVFLSALSAFLCFLINLSCTTQLAGGSGSDEGHSRIMGTLYEPCGKRPAAHADVRMRLASVLADTTGGALVDAASGKTDASGAYSFAGVDTGVYVVEGFDSADNRVLIKGVHVSNIDSSKTLGPDTLKPGGAIKGKIILIEGGDPRKILVFSFGIDRFARVNSDGSFLFPDLARGTYTLRVLPLLPDYGVLDTAGIAVKSADTTDIGAVSPRFIGIPTPKNVTISYDTLKQIVTLTWGKADTALVKSYNIYRRNVDSNTVFARINASPVIDTVYRDSTGVQNLTYEYRVAAVNKSAAEGTRSVSCTVTMVSAFRFVKDFGTPGAGAGQFLAPEDIAVDRKGGFWVADEYRNKIMSFDSSGAFLFEWGVNGSAKGQLNYPFGLDIDPQQNIVVCDFDGSRVEKFDTLGNLILEIDSSGIQIKDVSVDEKGNIYVSMTANGVLNSIVKYNPKGVLLATWQTSSTFLGHGLLAKNGRVCCAGSRLSSVGHSYEDVLIEVFDTIGTHLGIFNVRQSGETGVIDIRDLDVDGAGRIYAVDPSYGLVRIFNPDFTFLTSFGVKGGNAGQFSCIQGIAICASGRIAITDQSSVHLFVHP
jgi:streptogramin lyase